MKEYSILISTIIVAITLLFINYVDFSDNSVDTSISKMIRVEIKGEVEKPGIYLLKEDSTLYDLVNLAGGLTMYVNKDDIKLLIPLKEYGIYEISDNHKSYKNNLLRINYCNIVELMELDIVDIHLAYEIIEYVDIHGHFTSNTDLLSLKNMSDKVYEELVNVISYY